MEKRIEVVTLLAKELKHGFGNPRKISKQKKAELKASLETSGDFGCFIIDENNDLIGGNQRASIIQENWPEREVLCKRLVGYSVAEKKAINIRDNTHAGEWDLDLLADWTADLNLTVQLEAIEVEAKPEKIEDMELLPFERYNYVIIACRDEASYEELTSTLGIKDQKVKIGKSTKKRIDARAVWYDQMKARIVPLEESENGS